MKFNQSLFTVTVSLGLLLGACASRGEQTATSEPAASPSARNSLTASPEATDHSAPSQGGQVVEAGAYHLELVAVPESSGTHLDLFLQTGDSHEAVEGATVKGQVQLPDGSQQEVDFDYDAEGKHYVAMLPATASGEYNVVILTDIKGEKVNGRFSFTK